MADEYILQMGYYPDTFFDKGRGPDVFFIHIDLHEEMNRTREHECSTYVEWLREIVADAGEACVHTARAKYPKLDIADCFWSCLPKPEGV